MKPVSSSSIPSSRYLTVYDLATMLQCCPQTVRTWSRRGVLPPPLSLSRRKHLWCAEAVEEALVRLQLLPRRNEAEREENPTLQGKSC